MRPIWSPLPLHFAEYEKPLSFAGPLVFGPVIPWFCSVATPVVSVAYVLLNFDMMVLVLNSVSFLEFYTVRSLECLFQKVEM